MKYFVASLGFVRGGKAILLTGLLRLCLAMTFLSVFVEEVYALPEGQVILDFKEENDIEKFSFMESAGKSLEILQYFEKNYPDEEIEEEFTDDLEKFFPNMDRQRLYNTEGVIRFGIKAYRFVNQIIDEVKARAIAPTPPPLILDDDEYEKVYNKPYIESDELVLVKDFKKVISYSTDPDEIIAYTNKIRRDQNKSLKLQQSPFTRFFDMLSNVEISKLPFYNILYSSPITGSLGSGDWIVVDKVGARLLTNNSTINDEEKLKGVIQFSLPEANAVLAQDKGEYKKIKFDFSKSKNLKGFSVFYPAPVRNKNLAGEQIIGYSGTLSVPVIYEVEDITEPLEIDANIEFGICNIAVCKQLKINPKMTLRPGEGYISTYSHFVEQSFNMLPNMESKDIKLLKHFVIVPLNFSAPQSLFMEFEVSSASKAFDVFVSEQSSLEFEEPVISMNGGKIAVKMTLKDKNIDLRGKELNVIAKLDYSAPLQTFIVPEEEAFIENISKNISLSILISALIAGLVASIMPSVLPLVLLEGIRLKKQSLKVIAAIFGSMLLIAGVIVSAKTAGYSLGFGMHLQSPILVVGLLFLFLIYMLKTLNIIKIKLNPYVVGIGVVLGTFIFGFPYMSSVMGVAFSYGWIETLIIITAIAIGLSVPWILIKVAPGIDIGKTKIGRYMILMILFTIFWLFLIIAVQVSGWAVFRFGLYSLIMFLAFGFRKMFMEEVENSEYDKDIKADVTKRYNKFFAIALVILIGVAMFDMKTSFDREQNSVVKEKIDLDIVQNYIKNRKSVLVIIEAKWCLSCKYNDFIVLNKNVLGELFRQKGIDIIRIDWSDYDKKVLDFLENFGRRSVPSYILFTPKYPGGIILPEIMDQRDMEKIIKNVS